METTRINFILLLFFSFLFGTGTWILNSLEGKKISTTEFVDLGSSIGWISGLAALFIIGPLVILPVTWFLNKMRNPLIIKMLVFTVLNMVLGLGIFKLLFNGFIEEFQLKSLSACMIFAVVGIGYALFEYKSALWNDGIGKLNGPKS